MCDECLLNFLIKSSVNVLSLPSFFSHLTMFPTSMVGESAGICTLSGLTPRGEKENNMWFTTAHNVKGFIRFKFKTKIPPFFQNRKKISPSSKVLQFHLKYLNVKMHQVTCSEVALNSLNKALGGPYVQLAAEHKRQRYHENVAMSVIQLCSWMTVHQKMQRHLYHCGLQLSPSVVTQKARVHTRASGCQKKT